MAEDKKKRSGATHRRYSTELDDERHLTLGWRYKKNHGLISYRCVLTQKSVLSEKGWYSHVYVTVTSVDSGQKSHYWATMHRDSGKVVIDDLQMVINPKANNGGYCGTYKK